VGSGAGDGDLVRSVLGMRIMGKTFGELDQEMSGTGHAAAFAAVVRESIFADLRTHGFETDAVAAAQAAYDEKNGNDGPVVN
jgi:hypothetical protein